VEAGTVHVPVDQLPAALRQGQAEWEAAYHCAKPSPDAWLVLQSRTGQRAAWAAQVRHWAKDMSRFSSAGVVKYRQ